MDDIIILGAGGHAKILIDIIHRCNSFNIVGIIGSHQDTEETLSGYQIYRGDDYLDYFLNKGVNRIGIGIGGYRDNSKREVFYNRLKLKGFIFPNLIDPSSVVSQSACLGDAVVVFAGVVINAEVTIGSNVIIATSSSIDHETVIEDHVLISAGVTIGAGNIIQQGVLIALGAKIISRVAIPPYTLIGAGAVVTKDITEPGTYMGIPAKRIK